MKRSFFPIVIFFSLFVTFFSCSSKSNKRPRKPVSAITVQPVKDKYVFGDQISVEVNTQLKDGELKSVKLFYNNELVKESAETDFTFDNISLNTLGTITLKAYAEKTDGLNNTRTKIVNVNSDIAPQQMTYQVVENYPHLKTSYTQGLEYYKGYLYEGTGELGHSKLLKINIKTGEPVKSFDMDDKYFGEGITILNDKIYQLTYHAKKGFVYDMNSFAVIDSFTFPSAEGWGLCNDGTNLIMSDGTHVLTWLNPDDFSVVKKLQVANNKELKTNLNELEYIDGMIYANIYTSNIIVKIDASNGKVLEEIDMSGLIDLYNRQGDRIDYLNGIAYDREHDKMYVTGKLYPRLFEVKFVSK